MDNGLTMRTKSTANRRGGGNKSMSDQAPTKRKRVRATFHVDEELFDQCRDAVFALSGPPHRLTLASYVEKALRDELERLRKQENKGRPFPKRSGDLRGGPPMKM